MASKFRQPNAEVFRQKVKRRAEDRTSATGAAKGKFKNLPEGIEFFKPKKGTMWLDFISYVITVDKHPEGYAKGDIFFMKSIYLHYGVGDEEKTYVCPKTIGKPCPICDHAKQLAKDPDSDEDLIKDLRPKERNLFNVIDLDDPDKGVQLWEFSYHNFYKKLEEELSNGEDEFCGFALPEGGYTLKVRFAEKSFNKNIFLETSRIDFVKREKNIPDDVICNAPNLDEIVNVLEYDDLSAIFFGVSKSEDSSSEEQQESSSKQEEPSKQESAPSNQSGSSGDECPHGGTFGKSTDTLSQCGTCEVWGTCLDVKEGVRKP